MTTMMVSLLWCFPKEEEEEEEEAISQKSFLKEE